MKGKLLGGIPIFVVFSVLLIILYTPEQQNIALAAESAKPEICEEVKRSHFKNTCYKNMYSLKLTDKPVVVEVSYAIMIWEMIICLYLALFISGKAYFNFLEKWIEDGVLGKIVHKYRDLQEDSLYFFITF